MLSIMGLHLKHNFMEKTQRFVAAFTVHGKIDPLVMLSQIIMQLFAPDTIFTQHDTKSYSSTVHPQLIHLPVYII
jgi:hypothetical protein